MGQLTFDRTAIVSLVTIQKKTEPISERVHAALHSIMDTHVFKPLLPAVGEEFVGVQDSPHKTVSVLQPWRNAPTETFAVGVYPQLSIH